jgi:hypothetical protein
MERGCVVPGCERPFYARDLCNAHYLTSRKYPDETPEQLALRSRRARTPEEMREMLLGRLVERESGCLEWAGAKDRRGYGNVRWGGKLWGAHRLAYHLVVAPVERGVEVCHRCDNPPCCNVEHLFLGSHADNMADAAAKGISARVGNGGRTGALNGRARFSEDDVRAIRASSETQTALADRYGVRQTTISAIITRRTWKHVA